MSNRYFLYDPAGDGFQTFPTAELRDAAAKAAIGDCLEDDGWLEDVFNITVGEITGTATLLISPQGRVVTAQGQAELFKALATRSREAIAIAKATNGE